MTQATKTLPCRYKLVSVFSTEYQGETLLSYHATVEEADARYAQRSMLERCTLDDEFFLIDLLAEAAGEPRVCKVYETAYNDWEKRQTTPEECARKHNQPPYDKRPT